MPYNIPYPYRSYNETDEEFAIEKAKYNAKVQAERNRINQERLRLEREMKASASPKRYNFHPVRVYKYNPPIEPGMQFSRPADPTDPNSTASPPVTILSRVKYSNSLARVIKDRKQGPVQEVWGSYSNGLWNVRCFCGATYQASTGELNRRATYALHCPACPLPRKRRTQTFATRPGAERHLHATYGRLYVVEWLQREGWLCRCQCGADELVRRSVDLGKQGLRRCPHV